MCNVSASIVPIFLLLILSVKSCCVLADPMPAHMEDTEFPRVPAKELQRLLCSVKNYDWGISGRESSVARVFKANSGSKIEAGKPFAEFWMGTHESGPSFLVQPSGEENGSVTLKSWIERNPHVLGDKVAEKWGRDLPFLFKVLSVAKALSIQAHPDKEWGKVLHKLQPDVYKDANHKPEMTIAITEFKALCGFISLEELKEVLINGPEIVELVGLADANRVLQLQSQDDENEVKSVLQSIYTQLMSASREMVTKAIYRLKTRLLLECKKRKLTDKEQLVLQLEKLYPEDVGVISVFFFNYLKLNPGEALYIGPNEPHAYLSGECVECMATSDNVVRAGLTPKHKDVQTLCSMLTYKMGSPKIIHGVCVNPYIKKYCSPSDEFEIDSCILPKGASAVFPVVLGPSIFLIMAGDAKVHVSSTKEYMASEGDVFFAPADVEVTVTATSVLQLYRAGVSSRFFLSTAEKQQHFFSQV